MKSQRVPAARAALALAIAVSAAGCSKVAKLEAPPTEVIFYKTSGTKPSGITASDSAGKPVDASKVKWTTDDAAVATVSETGEITAVGPGDTRIRGKAGDASAEVVVRVLPVARIEVTPETVNLVGPKGTTALIESSPRDPKSARIDAKVRWTSSNPAVATVDGNGLVTSVSTGVTTAVVSLDTVKAEVPVRVDIRDLARIGIHPTTAILRQGDKQLFVATAFDSGERAIPNVPVLWKSTDPTVCTVDPAGLVQGMTGGTCIIEASFAGQTAQASVIVNAR